MIFLEIVLIVVCIYLWLQVNSANTKIDEINRKLGGQMVNRNQVSTQDFKEVPRPPAGQPMTSPRQVEGQRESSTSLFFAWVKENWILKLGIFLILVGFGWFVSYAFVHNWIGPIGRILIGFVVGSLVMLGGDIRMRKYVHQGGAFLILGAGIVLITIFSARFIYDMFDPTVALILTFVVSAFVTLASLRQNVRPLAISGLIMAFVAPLLTDSPDPNAIGLYLYLGVVSIAFIWVMFYKNWRILGALSVVPLILYGPNAYLLSESDKNILLMIVYSLVIVFFASNIASIIKNKNAIGKSDAALAILNGILVVMWTIGFGPEDWQSLLIALFMVIFAIGSFIVFANTKLLSYFYIYALESIVLLAIATTIELEGAPLVFAFIFEAAAISLAGYIITMRRDVGHKLSWLLLVPGLMSLESLDPYKWRNDFFHEDFGILFCMALALLGLGLFYHYIRKTGGEESNPQKLKSSSVMIIIGTYYLFALIWLSMPVLTDSYEMGILVSLLIYSLIGITCYVYGRSRGSVVIRNYGGVLVMLVVGRLLLVDVWRMELAMRITTFVAIGILFVSTAFIGKKDEKIISQ